ncbi:hypothetical protein KIS1582_2821 [Cytobacillus firmus]|uniref:Uncharacterized protein n=1 Tax=Cytobacillus firmus TaxID=1399 RepID=A0A800NA94_CYTFI|nr:hypothetical protein KIS1582_2821 [Cytobacillus firmus]
MSKHSEIALQDGNVLTILHLFNAEPAEKMMRFSPLRRTYPFKAFHGSPFFSKLLLMKFAPLPSLND